MDGLIRIHVLLREHEFLDVTITSSFILHMTVPDGSTTGLFLVLILVLPGSMESVHGALE